MNDNITSSTKKQAKTQSKMVRALDRTQSLFKKILTFHAKTKQELEQTALAIAARGLRAGLEELSMIGKNEEAKKRFSLEVIKEYRKVIRIIRQHDGGNGPLK